MNVPSEPVGPWLRREREAAGLTQEDLADRSGLSVRAISDLERGRSRRPYPRSVRMVVKALGLPDTVADQFVTQLRVAPAAREAVAVPRQLPAAAAHFVGRAAELKALDELLEQADDQGETAVVISAIEGTAGIGKTALALRWAHEAAGWFRDGQLYINLRGFDPSASPVPATTVVRRFLDAFAVPPERIPADVDAQADLYRSLVAGKRMLIVLDNARDPEQVRPLLPGAAGCLILITSRNRLADLVAVEGAVPLTVGLFSTGEARELMARRLGAESAAREPASLTEIVNLCGRLPLALNIAASWAATHQTTNQEDPLKHLAAELRDAHQGLELLSAGRGSANLRAVFSWSYDTLTEPAARMFRRLGLHPGPDFSIAAAASLAAVGPDQARRAVGELMAVHLLNEQTSGRYAMHDLLRAYAAEQAGLDDERAAATNRMLDHYLHTARAAARLLFPARDPVEVGEPAPGAAPEAIADERHALAWFDAEHVVLLAATVLAADAGFDQLAWQLPTCVAPYLERRGHWHDYATAQRIALAAAERTGDLAAQGNAHCLLARAHGRLGSYAEANEHLQRALVLYRALDDHTGQAHTHHSLGWVCGQQGRYQDALDHALHALALYRAAGHRTGEARTLNTVGWYGSLLGLHQPALIYCQQALELHRELGNHDGEADAWDSLGHAHHHLGQHPEAVACYQHALDLFTTLGDQHQQADTLTRLGDVYCAAGDSEAARDAWSQALGILTDLRRPDVERLREKLT